MKMSVFLLLKYHHTDGGQRGDGRLRWSSASTGRFAINASTKLFFYLSKSLAEIGNGTSDAGAEVKMPTIQMEGRSTY